jgi:glycosyltransferase involved in cell wall biosynthesis
MPAPPRITVVTPSYNQGKFLARTIDSVAAQGYPDVEHIVVDGLSSDDTPAVLARYPHLRVVREKDRGQADAINKGFRLATGDIFCFLNSDDVFLPGALHRVAREIDPAAGRHVVMGRCPYIDADDRPTGIEHPSAFGGHERVLKVWHYHCIPQPATFWTREVWDRCGPLDADEHLVLDFDLMCRISRRYHFHFIDQALACYRLHSESKTCSNSDNGVHDAATRVSRRYWGPAWMPRYWRLACSLARHKGRRRAADWLLRAGQAQVRGRRLSAAACRLWAVLLAPDVALGRLWRCGAAPLLPRVFPGVRPRAYTWQSPRLPEHATAWRGFTGLHADDCVGPHYAAPVHLPPGARWLRLEGAPVFRVGAALDVEVALDGRTALRRRTAGGPFALDVPVADYGPGEHRLEVRSGPFVLKSDVFGNGDTRPLVFRLLGVHVRAEGGAAEAA